MYDMEVEAESKYSLFNLSTFAEKETTRQKLSIEYTQGWIQDFE